MRTKDIADELARETHISKAAAADCVDKIVHDILKKLREGEAVRWPGLGDLLPAIADSKKRKA